MTDRLSQDTIDPSQLIQQLEREWLPVWRQKNTAARVQDLLESDMLYSVIKACPPPELLLTLKEYGPEDALPILAALPVEHVQAFLDIDGWNGFRLAPAQIGHWLELLFEANPRKATQQIRGLDIELVTLLLKLHTTVVPLEEDAQIPKLDKPSFVTPDRRYLILFSDHKYTAGLGRALKAYLQSLFEREALYALRLIESIRWELPSPLEEEAARFRNGRLQDLGYADIEFAGEIFGYIDPDSDRKAAPKSQTTQVPQTAETHTPVLAQHPREWLDDGTGGEGYLFFGKALAQLTDAKQIEHIQSEATRLANKYLMVSGAQLADAQSIRDALKYVLATVGVALQYRHSGLAESASLELVAVPLVRLFQMGHGLGLRLGRRMYTIKRQHPSWFTEDARRRVDAPLDGVLDGILRSHPLFFQGLIHPGDLTSRPFTGLSEITATAAALNEVLVRKSIIDGFELSRESSEDNLDEAHITDSQLLANALILWTRSAEFSTIHPLTIEDLYSWWKEVTNRPPVDTTLLLEHYTDEFQQRVMNVFLPQILVGRSEVQHQITDIEERAKKWVVSVMSIIADELGHIQDAKIDPRLLKSVWISVPPTEATEPAVSASSGFSSGPEGHPDASE